MNVLVAEDQEDIAILYKSALERKNHKVIITNDGEECLRVYNDELYKNTYMRSCNSFVNKKSPFDTVLLDYNMPAINGLEVAKEILVLNPHQRIIFASAYVKETLEKAICNLKQIVELIEKPFSIYTLINTIEDKDVYAELQKLNVDIEIVKAINPTHEQIMDLLRNLRVIKSDNF